jgi:POTRA domain, FtsQ-type/Cell division protein FtsQ/DivIB, C-terminal
MSSKREMSRAELVRTRLRQEAKKRPALTSAINTRTLPPIVSRTGMTYTVQQKGTVPSTKRRFQAAFSIPGFEMRFPAISLPRAEVKSRLFSLFLCLLLGTAVYLAFTLPEFQVTGAQVSGNQRISADEINSVLGSSGQPIFMLRPSDLETRLRLNYPELVSATVTVGLPNLLAVNIVERQPVILWQQGGGFTWIDSSGVAFRPHGTADKLITVNAAAAPPPGTATSQDPLSPVPFLTVDMVKAIQTLAPSVPAGTTMTYDPQIGFGWQDARGWKVSFGNNANDIALRLQVYQSLVNTLTQQGIVPTFISVQYANAPYYRMNQ